MQDLAPGDEIILTFWQTKDKMLINNIGYTEYIFERLGAKRALPQWFSSAPGSNEATVNLPGASQQELDAAFSRDTNTVLRRILSDHFMSPVNHLETYKYKLTTAIGELHLGTVNEVNQFAGVLYPSVRMWANGDNIALLPWFVDRHLKFRKALHIRIGKCEGSRYSIRYLDAANQFGSDGKLLWLGEMPSRTLQPRQAAICTCNFGVDDDGDYVTGPDGRACYWTGVDAATGQILKTSLGTTSLTG
ncbi:MAG: hypothetical protein WA633_21490 [Stellaceae bacterium]